MRVRVANKRKFTIWCCIFVLMILNIVFAIGKKLSGDDSSGGINLATKSNVVLAAESGSITLEENEYFKKYTINTKNHIDEVNLEESKDFMDIHLKKADIAKLSIKGTNKEVNDVFYENSNSNLVIKFKKAFNENNFVEVDKSNGKKIIVLIAKKQEPFHHIVALDAGHGGEDIGANVGSIYEKDITLKIADYTAEELRYRGFKVVRTRDEDKLLGLAEIGTIANAASADIFVSVHINYNKESIYKGVSTYYYDKDGYQKDERIKLAQTIQSELVKSDNWEDRGILRENFQVLRDTNMPSVLLECGFLSNPEDRNKLGRDEVLRNFSKNISEGVVKYFSSSEGEKVTE